jgi:RNA polymerase sigma factor (sigma-70 family)
VARVRAGDQAGLEAILRSFAVPLAAFAYRYVRSRDTAAELVQDVFYRIWRSREAWHIEGSLQAYLYRAIRNRVLDYLKHERIERRWAERSAAQRTDREARSLPSAEEAVETADLVARLEQVLDELPERRRQVRSLVLSYGGKLWRVEVPSGRRTTIPFTADVEQELGPLNRYPRRYDDSVLTARIVRDVYRSPDGRWQAFVALDKIWVMALPSGAPRRVTTDTDGAPVSTEHAPAWSPDGRYLAFLTWTEQGGHVYRVPTAALRDSTAAPPIEQLPGAGLLRQARVHPDRRYPRLDPRVMADHGPGT